MTMRVFLPLNFPPLSRILFPLSYPPLTEEFAMMTMRVFLPLKVPPLSRIFLSLSFLPLSRRSSQFRNIFFRSKFGHPLTRPTLSLHKNIVTSINARNNRRFPPILQPLSFYSLSQKIRLISMFAASHKTCCRLRVTLYCKLHTAMFLHNHIPHPSTTQQPT